MMNTEIENFKLRLESAKTRRKEFDSRMSGRLISQSDARLVIERDGLSLVGCDVLI